MKILNKTLLAIAMILHIVLPSLGQIYEPMICADTDSIDFGQGSDFILNSSNTLKPLHESNEFIRMLFVFVEFPGDTEYVSGWPIGQPPNYMDSFIDSIVTSSPTPGSITHYFDEMSMSNYNVIGKSIYVMAPFPSEYYVNLGTSPQNRWALYEDIINEIDQEVDLTEYANWNGHVFDPSNAEYVDMIGIIHRYFSTDHRQALGMTFGGGLYNGVAYLGGGTDLTVAGGATKVKRNKGSGFIITTGSSYSFNKQISIHEFGHYLFPNGNNDHINVGTWGIMAGYGSRNSVVNPYERQLLGWVEPQSFELGTQNSLIKLGDYVTTGDLVRIRVPGSINYLYLANHQKVSVFDTPDQTGGKGLYVLEHRDNFPNTLFPKMHAADGRWDWSVPEKVLRPLSWGPHTGTSNDSLPVFKQEDPNPTTGFFDVDRILYDWNGQQESRHIYVYKDPDTNENIWSTLSRGDGKDAFNVDENAFFGPWTNPRPLKPNGDVFSFAFHIENIPSNPA